MDDHLMRVLFATALVVGAGLSIASIIALLGYSAARSEHRPDGTSLADWAELQYHANPQRHFITLILMGTAFTLGLGGMGYSQFHAHQTWFGALLLPGLFVGLGFAGVVVPMCLVAKEYVEAWTHYVLLPLTVVSMFFWPFIWPFWRFGKSFGRFVGGAEEPYWTGDELAELALRARSEGVGDNGDDLLGSIIEFSDTVIREIMVPRTDMAVLNAESSDRELYATLCGGHSRIPVYHETIDNVIGILHVKDFFRASVRLSENGSEGGTVVSDWRDTSINMKDLLRPAFYVPESMQISELLREFQRRKTHLAVVVDEYGGTAGVVTLEDILEEIVGEIQDEYDIEERQYRLLPNNKILADGRVPLDDLQEVLHTELPEDTGFETLAGFLLSLAGYLPEVGSIIEWKDLKFTIKEANEKRIAMVEVEQIGERSDSLALSV